MNPEPEQPPTKIDPRAQANIRLALKLGLLAFVFLGFGFAMVPLYDVFCRITGINNNPIAQRSTYTTESSNASLPSRTLTVELTSQTMSGLPIVFRPLQERVLVKVGEKMSAKYYVRNLTGQTLKAQAIYSITPPYVSGNFHKIACFCFTEQVLAPGEEREMAVEFYIDQDINPKVTDIALSYTFYLQPEKQAKSQ